MTGDYNEAEDLLQTALTKVYVSWWRVSRAASPDAYVRKILVNQLVSWRRRKGPRKESPTDSPPEVADPSPETGITESAAMWQALATLPDRQRAVVVLRYYEDLSEREIAEALSIAPGTVKSQCSAGLQRLRAALATETTSNHGEQL
jgi:RNA polymerase sigma-70 factor (sigma-E family)